MDSAGEASADRYADVERLVAPEWLATKLIGPYIAGYLAALYLSGLFTQQAFAFYSSGEFAALPRRSSKNVLIALFALNVVYAVLVFEEAFGLAARQERTVAKIIEASYAWNALPLLAGWIGAITEAYLTVRAGSFITNRWIRRLFYVWMTVLIVNVIHWSAGVCGLGIVLNIKGGEFNLPLDWNTAAAIWLSCAAGADVSISLALAWSLRQRIAGFNHSTDSLLRKLIWIALRTAAYVSVLSITGAVVAAIWTDGAYETTDVNIAFWMPMPPLYAMSFFSTFSSSRRAIATTIGAPPLDTPPSPLMRVHSASPAPSPANYDVELGGVAVLSRNGTESNERREKGQASADEPEKRRSRLFRPPTRSSIRSESARSLSPRHQPRSAAGPGGGVEIRIEVTTQVDVDEDSPSQRERAHEAEERFVEMGEDAGAFGRIAGNDSRFLYPSRTREIWDGSQDLVELPTRGDSPV
ncbi:hypothetical protein JCM6882_004598 [Rhodosporidiobolus microsporus]